MNPTLPQISSTDQYIDVHWHERPADRFYYIWLFDNNPTHWHETGQKLVESRATDLSISPQQIRSSPEGLWITWQEQEVLYSWKFLQKYTGNKGKDQQVLWEKREEHTRYQFEKLSLSQAYLLNCLKEVEVYGFTRITGVPRTSGQVLKLVDLFGYVRETNYGKYYDVIAEKNPENLANTGRALAPHTDNPYREPTPTIQILHCLQANVLGGETILVDGFYLAHFLRENHPNYFSSLTTYPVSFQYEAPGHFLRNTAPVIEVDMQGNIRKIKFNNRSIQPFELPADQMIGFYEAYQYLENLIHQEAFQLRFKLAPGEAIIYDNERLLHGRTAFELQQQRHLQGCYADRDALMSTIRVLEKELSRET